MGQSAAEPVQVVRRLKARRRKTAGAARTAARIKRVSHIRRPQDAEDKAGDLEAATEPVQEKKGAASVSPAPGPLQDWVAGGLAFLEGLTRSLRGPQDQATESAARGPLQIETDPKTGQRYVKVAIPAKEVVSSFADLLARLAERL